LLPLPSLFSVVGVELVQAQGKQLHYFAAIVFVWRPTGGNVFL
jgi:hypothetical protein